MGAKSKGPWPYLSVVRREPVPALLQELKHENKDIRFSVILVLGEVDPASRAAVPAHISALQDENEDVRYHTYEALGTIGLDAKEALPALVLCE